MPIEPDEVMIILLLNAFTQCADVPSMRLGKEVLKKLPLKYFENSKVISSAISLMMKFGEVNKAEHLFERMENKNLVTYRMMMQGDISLQSVMIICSMNFVHFV